jgi:hypothetical protein
VKPLEAGRTDSLALGGYPAVADREPDEPAEEAVEGKSLTADEGVDGVVHTESRALESLDVE